MDQEKIGRFLKQLRKEKSLTQEQLSEKLNVTNRTVSRWENGVNMPDFDMVIEIVNLFDVSIEEFLDGERKDDTMIDKETEETILKVADYNNTEKMAFTKRLHYIFIAAIVSFAIFAVLDVMEVADTGVYGFFSGLMLGFVLGALILGALYTSRYMAKIRAFKLRLLKHIR